MINRYADIADKIKYSMANLCNLDDKDVDAEIKAIYHNLCHIIYKSLASEDILGKKTLLSHIELNENVFHSFMWNLVPISAFYKVGSDKNLGYSKGRPDIFMINKNKQTAVIIEVKYKKNAEMAYEQSKKYCEDLVKTYKDIELKKIIQIGVNFDDLKEKQVVNVMYSINQVKDNIVELSKNVITLNFESPITR